MKAGEAVPQPLLTVYIAIGNPDDRLTQAQWSMLHIDITRALLRAGVHFHGEWHSHPCAPRQTACWCIEVLPGVAPKLREELAQLAGIYEQDCITWALASHTDYLGMPAAM